MSRQSKAQLRAEKKRAAEEKRKRDERQRLIRTVGGIAGAVALVAVLLVAIWPEPAVGDTSAEAWDLPALEGEGRIALSDFSGKPTVVAFFASWCDVCEDEIPQLLALSEQIGDEVNFVGINSQDNGRGTGDADKWGITAAWPLAQDIGGTNGSGLSSGTFGMRGMPLNLIYDGAGNLVHVQPGGLGPDDALSLLNDLTEFGA